MRLTTYVIAILLGLTLLALVVLGFRPRALDNPQARLPAHPAHTDHGVLIQGPLSSPQDVTRSCLACHPLAAEQVMASSHWTWESDTARLPGATQTSPIGKKNIINNFCIGVQSNEARCMSCHAGYGWKDNNFDFSDSSNIDCLVCHDGTGAYRKDPNGAGMPAADVDLLAVAKSVGRPTRRNCGYCHFAGGGGDAVKHGDLDGTMYFPSERIDVHMGRHNLLCQDCHRTRKHRIRGRLLSVSNRAEFDVACTDCHSVKPHRQQRLNAHTDSVSCQACHIPQFAVEAPTKMSWDWSQAGQDLPEADNHTYDKKKGRFVYKSQVVPEYYWYDGAVDIYLPGQTLDPSQVLKLNQPVASIRDPQAKIWPFKVHRGKQIYDSRFNYLMVPKTVGPGGYWTDFNWDQALRLGSKSTGLAYSGQYGFTTTEMFWPITHMVAPKEDALQCDGCHGPEGRLDWYTLGYIEDPLVGGGRKSAGLLLARDAGGRQ